MIAETPSLSDLIAENAQCKSMNEQLRREVAHLQEQYHHEVAHLKEQLAWLTRQLFGQRSEKILSDMNENQLFLPGFQTLQNPEPEAKKQISAHERRTQQRNGRDKITFPSDLPVESHIIDLPEDEKTCTETGQELNKIGEEVTRKLAYKPGSYFIKEIIRLKYALPKGSEEGIRTAPLPDSLFPRCQADESLLADILTKKFADHRAPRTLKEKIGGATQEIREGP